jgi:hypothetical protein
MEYRPYRGKSLETVSFETVSIKGVEKQVSGRQPRRAAIWKAQHI